MITKRSLLYWVKTGSLKLQVLVLVLIGANVAARVFPLEMQKRIVNQAISMRKLNLLFLYCGLYLAAVLLASALKYAINIIQTYLGQQTLARIRKELYAHIISLPLSFFRKASSGMVVSSLVTEVVAAGELAGQAVAVPVNNLLTLAAFSAYMFYLNPLLAGLSIIIYPLVVIVIPRLQEKSNRANKMRIDITRNLSGKIGEAISGIHEVHGNCSYRIENRKYSDFVDQLFRVRIVWNLYRNGIKVLNNLFQSLGPFILFIVGGYLAINGRFDLGALVAFLSAYEKLYDPWKELMEFYQTYQDASVGYKRLMEYFDVKPEHAIEPPDGREPCDLEGNIVVRDLSFSVAGGIQLLKQINLDLQHGEQLALVGFSGSGKSTLAQCICQLYKYTGGSIRIDDREVSELSKWELVRNMGIVSQNPYIFDGTIRENLCYSRDAMLEEEGESNYGISSLDEMIEVIQQVGLFVDVLRFGMNTVLEPGQDDELVKKLIRVRKNFQSEFGKKLSDSVEFFDERYYLYFSSVAANLTFGNSNTPSFELNHLPDNEYFLSFLDKAQIRAPLMNLGRELATQAIDILGPLAPDEVFFRESPFFADEFEDYRGLVSRIQNSLLHDLPEEDQQMLLRLAMRFTPGVHKMTALPEMLASMILEARHLFMREVQEDHPGALTFYRMSDYIYSQTILDNILFGKPRTDHPNAMDRIHQNIVQLLIEEDLLERIVEIGMEFRVGTKGDRLSGGQRQKLAIARAFLKDPRILIMDEATSALDNASQKRIQNLLETKWKGKSTLIAVVHRLDTIKGYDKIAVMKAGKIIEIGTYDELVARRGILYELVHGAKTTG